MVITNLYYQNVRGLRGKTAEFKLNLLSNNYNIICLTETFLHDSIYSEELFDNRYVVYRKDRNLELSGLKDGGGCLIAINRDLNSSRRFDLETENEDICVEIRFDNSYSIFVYCVYIRPKSDINIYKNILDNISKLTLSKSPNSNIIFLGDFNIPHISWHECGEEGLLMASFSSNHTASVLTDHMSFCNFNQFNNIKNKNENLLDLVWSDLSPNEINIIESVSPLSKIDTFHPPLEIIINSIKIKTLKPVYNYKKKLFSAANYSLINSKLSELDFSPIENLNADSALDYLYESLNQIIITHIPVSNSLKLKYPSWYTVEIIQALKLKDKYHRKFKQNRSYKNYHNFSFIRKTVKNMIKIQHKKHIHDIESKLTSQPKFFWSYSKELRCSNTYSKEMEYMEVKSDNQSIIANMFSDYFSSNYNYQPANQHYSDNLLASYTTQHNSVSLDAFVQSEIYEILSNLDISKNPGPDGIPNILLKNCALLLSKPLTVIFNKFISEMHLPTILKSSHVTPIFKSGNKALVINYRPVSINNSIVLVLERAILNQLFPKISQLLTPAQHGFFKGRSTVTNLSIFTHDISTALDNCLQLDAIYTDFSKAFDKIDHKILLIKMELFGFCKNTISFFESYLSHRTQYVVIEGFKSDPFSPHSGVPQGSILGPLLFSIFINDITEIFESSCLLYADDLKLYRRIQTDADCRILQADLLKLGTWCNNNNLHLNLNKCNCISFSRKNNTTMFSYTINNVPLVRVKKIKDLGVVLDSKLLFDEHINYITSKSNKVLGFVLRTCKFFRNIKSYIVLYNTLVRSILEYGSLIWNPLYQFHSKAVESVQKRFTRVLISKFYSTYACYNYRLNKFNMLSLENRRLILDEIFLFKLLNGFIDCSNILQCINFRLPSKFTRCNDTFLLPKARTNLCFKSPLIRIQKNHNRHFVSVDLFCISLSGLRHNISDQFRDSIDS